MSKSCGITGIPHTKIRNDVKTASGEKSVAEDVFVDDSVEVFYEVNDGTKAKPVMRSVKHLVKGLIRQFVIADNNAKLAKEQAEEASQGIKIFVSEHREERFKNTDRYQGSYRVNGEVKGKTQYAVQVNAQNRVSLPKKEKDMDTLRDIVGKEWFAKVFERELNISIRKEVLEDRKMRRQLTDKLIKAFGEEGLKEWFVKSEEWGVKDDVKVNEIYYELDTETRQEAQEICPLYADQIKNVCYDPTDV
jgi:hypothetical protein